MATQHRKRGRAVQDDLDQQFLQHLTGYFRHYANTSTTRSRREEPDIRYSKNREDLRYGNTMLNMAHDSVHTDLFESDFGAEALVAHSLLELKDTQTAKEQEGETDTTLPLDTKLVVPEAKRHYTTLTAATINVETKFATQHQEAEESLFNLFKEAAAQAASTQEGTGLVLAPAGILGKAGHSSVFRHPLTDRLCELCSYYNVVICAGSAFLGPHLDGKYYEMAMIIGPQTPTKMDREEVTADVLGLYKARTVPSERTLSLSISGKDSVTEDCKLQMQPGQYPAICGTPLGKMTILIDEDLFDSDVIAEQLQLQPNCILALISDSKQYEKCKSDMFP